MGLNAAERKLRARLAAHAMHARHGLETSSPGTAAFLRKFEVEVDPERELDEAERQRRAKAALRSHMAGLRLRQLTADRKRREASDKKNAPARPNREGVKEDRGVQAPATVPPTG